jgi:serine/threonine-protein kinase
MSRAPEDDLQLAGTILERKYRIDSPVAEGGFGVVYAGHHLSLDVPVAVKILKPDREVADEDWTDRVTSFLEEARMLARLRHPNIVAALDSGVVHVDALGLDVPWVVLEWLEGETLRDALAKRREQGGRPPAECMRLLRPVLEAIAAAHDAGVIHRDIKPSNVMLVPDGHGGVTPRVLDFGVAKVMRPHESQGEPPSGDTATGSAAGGFTVASAAPEQLSGTRTGPWTDVFALGLLLVEVLVDGAPLGSGDANEHYRSVFGAERPTPARRGVDVGPWEVVLARALAVRPGERQPNAGALLRELDASTTADAAGAPAAATADYLRDTTQRRASLSRTTAWGAGAFALLAVTAGLALRTSLAGVASHASSPSAASTASTPPRKPLLITDLPSPPSSSPDAVAAYRRGLEAWRAGSVGSARKAFEEATKKDPSLAEAWLRIAMITFWAGGPEIARAALQKIEQPETRLDAHHRALFDAYQLAVMHDPPDFDGFLSRLAASRDLYPEDSEIAAQYATALRRRDRLQEAVAAFERSIPLDPTMAEQYRFEAEAQAGLGDLQGALATADRCDANAPTSAACPSARLQVHVDLGACSALEADARDLMMRDPASGGPRWLAEALASEDAAPEAVRAALDRWNALYPDDAQQVQQMRLSYATWLGDFDDARAAIAALEKLAAADANQEIYSYTEPMLAGIALETGQLAQARRLAEHSLATESSRLSNIAYTDRGLRTSQFASLLSMAREGGMPDSQYEKRRDAWLSDWRSHLPADARGTLWLIAYAGMVTTADEAKAALAVLPEFEPLPQFRPQTSWYKDEGNTYLLAGDLSRALPLLERGAAACDGLVQPFARNRAQLVLGMAREQAGDRAGACTAYGTIMRRWAKAKPRSVTLEKATARAKALGCSP